MSWTVNRHLRCLAGFVAAAALAGVSMTPAAAAPASGPGFGPFGMTPSPAQSGQPRPYFNFAAAPGQRLADSVVVTNLSRTTERLRLAASTGVTAANSGSAYENVTGRCTGPACWISGLPPVLVLAPKQQRLVGFTVRVPRRVRRGQYLAGLSLLAARRPKSVVVGQNGHASARAIIIEEVTVGVAVTIGAPSALTSGLRIGPVTARWIGPTPRLNIGVRNTGQTFLRATGQVRCVSAGRARSYRVVMETVLPAGHAVLAVNAPGLKSGALPCQVRLRTATGHRSDWSGRVTLASMVVTRTYHPAAGVFVSMPEQTMPAWAVVLIVLGGLILLALVLLLAQRRRASTRRARRRRAAHAG